MGGLAIDFCLGFDPLLPVHKENLDKRVKLSALLVLVLGLGLLLGCVALFGNADVDLGLLLLLLTLHNRRIGIDKWLGVTLDNLSSYYLLLLQRYIIC